MHGVLTLALVAIPIVFLKLYANPPAKTLLELYLLFLASVVCSAAIVGAARKFVRNPKAIAAVYFVTTFSLFEFFSLVLIHFCARMPILASLSVGTLSVVCLIGNLFVSILLFFGIYRRHTRQILQTKEVS